MMAVDNGTHRQIVTLGRAGRSRGDDLWQSKRVAIDVATCFGHRDAAGNCQRRCRNGDESDHHNFTPGVHVVGWIDVSSSNAQSRAMVHPAPQMLLPARSSLASAL